MPVNVYGAWPGITDRISSPKLIFLEWNPRQKSTKCISQTNTRELGFFTYFAVLDMNEALHLHRRRGDRQLIIWQQRGMGHSTCVHQLTEEEASFSMNLGGHFLPPFEVSFCVYAGCSNVSPPVRRGCHTCKFKISKMVHSIHKRNCSVRKVPSLYAPKPLVSGQND